MPDGDYPAFMERYTGKTYPQGNYLDQSGAIVGRHQGAVRYTIGQRKGLNLALGEPVYVCSKDMAANTVTVGPNSALFSSALRAGDWNWFPFDSLRSPQSCTAKIRHSQTETPARVYPEETGFARVEFESPSGLSPPARPWCCTRAIWYWEAGPLQKHSNKKPSPGGGSKTGAPVWRSRNFYACFFFLFSSSGL